VIGTLESAVERGVPAATAAIVDRVVIEIVVVTAVNGAEIATAVLTDQISTNPGNRTRPG
jgi:hypothetical protein